MNLNFGSVCSGIEAASVAWEPLGLEAAWFAEIDRGASEVLAYRYPAIVNHGDMTLLAAKVRAREIVAPDILVGGTPCQAFSIAGMRKGLSDDRGKLTLSFVVLADAIDAIRREDNLPPCIIVWENVPGVLNHADNPFGCFLAGIAGESDALIPAGKKWSNAGVVLGPERAIAWRVQDAQYHGLAQRRRRVFVVASAREGFDPVAILFEFEGVRRDSPPRREAGEGITHATAPCLTSSGRGVERAEDTRGQDPIVACAVFNRQSSGEYNTLDIASTVSARDYKSATDLVAFMPSRTFGRGDLAYAMTAPHGGGRTQERNILDGSTMAVRRLMPVECERLQGFPDNWTLVPTGKKRKPAADGPRYKQLGNSMATNVMRWIGERILQQEGYL